MLVGVDIRTVGSGNPGATNVWRTFGFKLGLAVALLDIAKGAAAALLGVWLGDDLIGVLAGVAALVGHWRPLFLRFARGGKTVATTGGVALALALFPALAAAGTWIVVFLATRYASVASLAASIARTSPGCSPARSIASTSAAAAPRRWARAPRERRSTRSGPDPGWASSRAAVRGCSS